jgi:hypothetical protein
MRTRPAVTKTAPIQSTRLSFSVDGSSFSKTKYPNIIKAKPIPDNKNIGVRQVALCQTMSSLNVKQMSDVLVSTHLVTCVRTPPITIQKIPPIGAPTEKVANAMDREGPGGNDLAKIPS